MHLPFFNIVLVGLDKANYDRAACQEEFEAYKECKKQEVTIECLLILELGYDLFFGDSLRLAHVPFASR